MSNPLITTVASKFGMTVEQVVDRFGVLLLLMLGVTAASALAFAGA